MIEYRYMRKAAPGVNDEGKLTGRAWPYDSVTQIGKAPWGFREKLRQGAGKKSINDGDIVLLDNHETRLPLARMSAGTLEMRDTKSGGEWEATPADTSYAQDVVKNVRAKNYGGCSFGFEVIRDEWTDDEGNPSDPQNGTNREILEMKVHEISVCTFPAYTATSVSARDQVLTARGALDERMKASPVGNIQKQSPHGPDSGFISMTPWDPDGDGDDDRTPEGDLDHSHWDEDGNQIAAVPGLPFNGETIQDDPATFDEGDSDTDDGRAADPKKPYGDVTYADPGYQKDKKKRYPVETKKHAMAAWSYIAKAKNAAAYTAQQLASIKSKIKAALAKFGVKTAEANMAEWEALCDFREMTEGYDPESGLDETDFGVMPDGFVRTDDANDLADKISNAATAEDRVNCIQLATDLSLAELLPAHWGSAGEVGAGATDDVRRDMDEIYSLALKLPPTRTALAILDRANPYLSQATRDSKVEEPEPQDDDGEVLTMTLADARKRLQEAKDRRSALDRA